MSGELIRTFIAVDLPQSDFLPRIVAVQRELEQTGADLKLVAAENIHITLRFIGEVGRGTVDEIAEAVKASTFTPFIVKLTGLGVFPSLNRINVIWIGIRKGASELQNIFSQIEPRLRALGITPDNKGFSPHLTIARVRSGRNRTELAQYVKTERDRELGEFQVESVNLKRSVLTPKGPIYSTLYTHPALKAGS